MEKKQPGHADIAEWLTVTKLHPPRLRTDIILRQRLLGALYDAVLSHALALVSAPAGYGKTTLLATLVESRPELPVAWLSLDEEDNDPYRFLGSITAAIQRAVTTGAPRASVLLDERNLNLDVRRVVGALINDLADAKSDAVVLVLDDLHLVIEPKVYIALDYLLEHLPPQMHIVVSARHDPPLALARLRARGQLAEMRLNNIRFSPDETATFLNNQLHMNLTADELTTLYNDTEGWAAGLRLLGNTLGQIQAPAERRVFIERLTRTSTHVFDFLVDEVLAHQTERVRTFLLETSILPELTPRLCQAVTGRVDATAILGDVYRRNLFLVAVDEAGTTYRYHHLFAEFLRRRLEQEMPGQVAELQRRAAIAEVSPTRAVSHYLAADLWEQAANKIEQVGEHLLDDGLWHTLRGWIESLPSSMRETRPRLVYILGMCALQHGDLEQASLLLENARAAFDAGGDEAGQGEALLGLVDVASEGHDYQQQATLVNQALARPLTLHGRVRLLLSRVWQEVNGGDFAKADADLEEVLRITLESGDRKLFSLVAPTLRTHLALLPGGTERLERLCRQMLAMFGEGIGPLQAGAHSLLGYIEFLHGRLDSALEEADRARNMSQQLGGFTFLDGEIDLVLTSVHSARDEHEAAENYWKSRLPWIEQTPTMRFWTITVLYYIGRAQWMQGQLEEACLTYARMSAIKDPHELPEVTVCKKLMQALLELSDRNYAEAESSLRAAIAIEDKNPQCLVFGSARLLLAHFYLEWKRPRAAVSEFEIMLADCERRHLPGIILREGAIMVPLLRLAAEHGIQLSFGTRLLGLFGETGELRRVYVPDTGETLTSREVEVLGLIAHGASNQQVAGQLVITETTVKSHMNSILRKLNVTSRTQAITRALDLGII